MAKEPRMQVIQAAAHALLIFFLFSLFLQPAAASAADPAPAAGGENLEELISEGHAYISGRYRFEFVDQDGIANEAKASTLRTRLGFDTGEAYDLSGKLEFEDVSVIGGETYNSTVNGRDDYPIVADPDGTEVNQAYASFAGVPQTVVRGGREALALGNVRFIGDVGWRQNNQTYDGINIVTSAVPGTKVFYGYVGHVNRIFGEDSPVGDFNTNLQLLNAEYSAFDWLTATVFTYLYDVKSADNLSTSNFGGRLHGAYEIGDGLEALYDGEYAYQQDYADNEADFSAPYWRASLGAARAGFSLRGGYEVLGSDNGEVGFSTPFATLHAWNGWADKFLTTPADGLEDAFGGAQYTVRDLGVLDSISAEFVYHYFQSNENSTKYGAEWDFNVAAAFQEYFLIGVKYADYDAASFATDTEKLIFTLQAVFTQ